MADYEAQVALEPLPGRPYPHFPEQANPQAFGSEIGQGIEGAGQAIQGVQQRALQQARTTQVTDANNQLQTLMTSLTSDPKTGAFTKQGKNAFGLTDQYLPQFDNQAGAIISGIPDAKAQQAATQMVAHARGQFVQQLDNHEAQQHQQYADQTDQASIGIAKERAAANYNHPDILASNKDTMDMSLENMAQRQGWSDEKLSEEKASAHSSMHTGVIYKILADGNAFAASGYLEANKNDMEPAAAWSASRLIDSQVRQKSNELAANTKAQITSLSASYRAGLPVDPSQELTPGKIEAAFPGQGQELWADLMKDKKMGADLKDVNQLAPADLAGLQDKYTVKKGGNSNVDDLLARQKEIGDAVALSVKQRQSDPRGFAIANGIGGSKPIDWSDPQAILSGLQSRDANGLTAAKQIGFPTPLLAKPEAKQFGDFLDSVKPQEKAQWLGKLAGSLSLPAYQSLMDQIQPDKPITAIVGTQLRAASPATPAQWFNPQYAMSLGDADKILTGEQLLKGKEEGGKGFPMPPDHNNSGTGTRDYFATASKTVFSGRPQLAEAAYGTFRAAYAGLLADAGDYSGNGKGALMKQAYNMAVGPSVMFHGKSVGVPSGMDPSHFGILAQNAIAAAAKSVGADKNFADHLSNDQLQEIGGVGTGRFQLVIGNQLRSTPDGKQPFPIIDLRQQYGER